MYTFWRGRCAFIFRWRFQSGFDLVDNTILLQELAFHILLNMFSLSRSITLPIVELPPTAFGFSTTTASLTRTLTFLLSAFRFQLLPRNQRREDISLPVFPEIIHYSLHKLSAFSWVSSLFTSWPLSYFRGHTFKQDVISTKVRAFTGMCGDATDIGPWLIMLAISRKQV